MTKYEIPESLKNAMKPENTDINATVPNSDGDNRRDVIVDERKEIEVFSKVKLPTFITPL
jgi:hypothetical protein